MVTSQFLGICSGAVRISLFLGATLSLGMWFPKFRTKHSPTSYAPWIFEKEGDALFRNVGKPLLIYTASHPKGRASQRNFILCVYTERYVISGRIPEVPFIQFTAVPHVIFCFQQTAGRPFSCTEDAEEWRCPTSGTGVDTRRVQRCLDLSIFNSVSDCCMLYCHVEIQLKQGP